MIQNKKEMNGELLSDSKNTILRGALLAALVGDVKVLRSFLEGDSPSGPRVTVLASFLVGLKTGLSGLPWREKAGRTALWCLAGRVLSGFAGRADMSDNLITRRTEITGAVELSLLVGPEGEPIVQWETPRVVCSPLLERWKEEFAQKGCRLIGPGAKLLSWIVAFENGREFHLEVSEEAGAGFQTLRYRPANGEKFKKTKDLANLSKIHGHFWHLADDEVGKHLYCDLLAAPDAESRKFLESRLLAFLDLPSAKVARPRKPRTPKPKVGVQSTP